MINVCVCGGSNPATNSEYYKIATIMGELLCENNCRLVWGGNAHGVLARVYEHYEKNKKPSILFLPEVYKNDLAGMSVKDYRLTADIVGRTVGMYKESDVILFLPGGIGTAFEFWAAVELFRAGEIKQKIILVNHMGFFKNFLEHLDFIIEKGFTKIGVGGNPYKIEPRDLFKVVETPEQAMKIILKTKPKNSAKNKQKGLI